MKKYLFVGDVNVDLIFNGLEEFPKLDKEITCKDFQITIGSSSAISSYALKNLGADSVSFCGLCGDDEYGNFMIKSLKELGIDTNLIVKNNKFKTGITLNLNYNSSRSQVTYLGSIEEFCEKDLILKNLSNFDHLHFAGVYQQKKFLPHLSEILKKAKELGLTSSLDPQWDNSERWENIDTWIRYLDILFINKDEASSISKKNEVPEIIDFFKGKGCSCLLKLGGDGAYYIGEKQIKFCKAFDIVDFVDSTGAGDNFAAGFLYSRFEKLMDLDRALEFANACGARACMFLGGINARSKEDDISKMIRKVN